MEARGVIHWVSGKWSYRKNITLCKVAFLDLIFRVFWGEEGRSFKCIRCLYSIVCIWPLRCPLGSKCNSHGWALWSTTDTNLVQVLHTLLSIHLFIEKLFVLHTESWYWDFDLIHSAQPTTTVNPSSLCQVRVRRLLRATFSIVRMCSVYWWNEC